MDGYGVVTVGKPSTNVIVLGKDNSGKITVAFHYNPQLVAKVKTIEGRKWHPAEKHWSFPYSDGTLEKILKVFEGEEIQIDPVLQTKLPTRIIAKSKDSSPVIARNEVPKQSQKSIKIIPPLAKQPLIIPPLEKGGKGGFESGLPQKFEDLRRELISRKYSYKNSKTTEIYTHVSTKSIGKIKSPLDSLNLKKGGVEADKLCQGEGGLWLFSQSWDIRTYSNVTKISNM